MFLKPTGLLLSYLCFVPATIYAQSPTPAALPKDPVALLNLLGTKNGLDGTDVQPWHIRGSYSIYGSNGKLEDSGIYEEWWASDKKYKRSFSSQKFTQVEYADGNKLYRQGAQEWPSGDLLRMRTDLIEPVPDDSTVNSFKLDEYETSLGKGKAACVNFGYPMRPNLVVTPGTFPLICTEANLPMVRITTTGRPYKVVHNQIVAFQGHYLARELKTFFADKPRVDLNLDTIQLLKDVPDSLFNPPIDAMAIDLTSIAFNRDMSKSYPILLRKDVPEYPQAAKQRRSQGTVVLKVTIGADGNVSDIQAVSGPYDLRKSAQDAVVRWRYRPLRVMGESRSVQIEVDVIYSLG